MDFLSKDKTKDTLPVDDILLDEEFNHRGHIDLASIASLIAAIKEEGGLIQPINVRPIKHEQYKWQVIDGHRRLTAYQRMGVKNIPVVKDGEMSVSDAKTRSAMANLQRKDLNIMQEARAIRHLWAANMSRNEIADQVRMSPGWVQLRCMLLTFPEDVQRIADKGFLVQEDIRVIDSYPRDKQLEVAKQLHDRRQRGVKVRTRKPEKRSTKRIRRPEQVEKMMEYLRSIMLQVDMDVDVSVRDLITPSGNIFATSALAWAAGFITNEELHLRLQKYCEVMGHGYIIPAFDENLEVHCG